MLKRILLLCLAGFLTMIVGKIGFAGTFSNSDLSGTWRYQGLISGDTPNQTPGWYWGARTIDASGNATSSTVVTDSLGNSDYTPGADTFNLSSDGVVTDNSGLIRGIMNGNKDTMIITATMCPGRNTGVCGFTLMMMVKESGASFNTSDLSGTWRYQGLISGDTPNQTPGWYWGARTIDASGNATSSTVVTDSLGNSDYTPGADTFNLSSDGVVTDNSGLIRGIMNGNKDTMIITATMCPGRNTGVCGFTLMMMVKESGASFNTSDLSGTWDFQMLSSGESPQWLGWVYGIERVEVNGDSTFTSITRSDGNSSLPSDYTMAFSSTGIVTTSGSDFHGVMNTQKDMFIGVMTDGGGGYDLILCTKRSHANNAMPWIPLLLNE